MKKINNQAMIAQVMHHMIYQFFSVLDLNRNAVTRINSLPAFRLHSVIKGSTLCKQDVSKSIQVLSDCSLEVGSMVEVMSDNGVTIYGVVRWIGVPEGKKKYWAGLELVSCPFTVYSFI